MSKKPVILPGMLRVNKMESLVIDYLKKYGFEVVDISYNHIAPPFKYKSLGMRLDTFVRKNILREKDVKKKLIEEMARSHFEAIHKKISELIDNYESFDYALILGGQVYPKDLLLKIKQKTKKSMVAYQPDGMDRFPQAKETIEFFDRFYAFDPQDIKKYTNLLYPASNFYFENLAENPEISSDFYFIGAHLPILKRDQAIATFARHAAEKNWNLDFTIFHIDQGSLSLHHETYPENIKATLQPISFAENIYREQQSKVLLDFKTPIHTGLSFRTIEAVGYHKKLITTNIHVAKYDFYHPNNIYIWDEKTFDGLDEFLESPYHELPAKIYQKYSFRNWVNYVLNIPPHIAIGLPEADS